MRFDVKDSRLDISDLHISLQTRQFIKNFMYTIDESPPKKITSHK